MKKIMFLLVLAMCNISIVFSQTDTAHATLHPDANTAYLDENGAKIDAMKFVQTMSKGGYTMQPVLENSHIKSLQLKKTENKISTGAMAPDFSMTDISGQPFSLKALQGKTLVLNFWFVNCPGCVQEMPALDSLADSYKNDPDVVFLAPTFDDDAKVKTFLQKHRFSYRVVANQTALVQQYGVQAFPFSLVIDKSGHIAFSGNTDMGDVAGQLRDVIEAVRK